MYLFSNVLGVFVFDESFKVIDKLMFKDLQDYQNKNEFIESVKAKHNNLKEPDEKSLSSILLYFKTGEFLQDFKAKNTQLTKRLVKDSVKDDILLIQSLKTIEETGKAINLLAKRLRDWYDLYNPEFSRSVESHETFVNEILENEKKDLLKKMNISGEDSIGADLEQENLEPLKSLAQQVFGLFQLRKLQLDYISNLMDSLCPNIKTVCEVMIGAKLIEHAGSLKRLSEMPSSTIQILGAEKALFRHMKTGAKPPRHGLIVSHPLIAHSDDRMHGKIARNLADKISIAAKVDYFQGQFVGDRLKKELEEKFSSKW